MSPGNAQRFDINRKVRSVLVKHWIDLGRVRIRTVRDRVHLQGSLCRLPGSQSELTSPVVDSIFQELQRIREIRYIRAELDNWIQAGAGVGNGWVRTDTGHTAADRKQAETSQGESLRIEDQ